MEEDNNDITVLLEKLTESETTIKELNNKINDYETKIENMTSDISDKEKLINKLQSVLAKNYIASTEHTESGVTDFATAYNNLIKENSKM